MGRYQICNYTLSEDAYARYEELLSEQGIKAVPERKETSEMVRTGEVNLSIYGALHFQNGLLPFTLTKERHRCILSVEPCEIDGASAKELVAGLNRAFPQPERGHLRQPKPEKRTNWNSFLGALGCAFVLLLTSLVCLFTILGLYSVFK